ncbi:4'-phosphopantetheinyl transferase superfamily protein [Streptacidiphilus sp. 4-A2]|nr:4'-phosphopantetheinyl transferase superfamily protein [Streptacidiphilus sp. 4-A2]
MLDQEECERARAAAADPVRRDRFTVVHGAVRLLAARRLGLPPAELVWRRGPHGKPEPVGPEGRSGRLHLNYSASGALAVLALSVGRRVGADVEQLPDERVAARVAARFFPEQDARSVASAPSALGRSARFARLWCRREACVKVYGGRLAEGLRLPVGDDGPLRLPAGGLSCSVRDVALPAPCRGPARSGRRSRSRAWRPSGSAGRSGAVLPEATSDHKSSTRAAGTHVCGRVRETRWMTVIASVSRMQNVGFSSGSSGSGPATWGQLAIWDAIRKLGDDAYRYNVSSGFPVRPGVPVPRVLDALGRLVELHESLRTRLEPDDSGGLRQILDGSGSIPVHLLEADADQAEPRGRALLEELVSKPFDCATEWPMRMAVVHTEGLMTFVGFCLSHTAVDGWGLSRVVTDLFALATGDSPEQLRERHPALQPRAEAAFQASDRGRRRDANARQFWARKLRQGPRRIFTTRREEPADIFPNAVLNSPALARAVELVAAGHRVSTSSVLLAAASVNMARLTGTPDAMFQVVVSNRFRPELAHAVTTVAQEGLIHLPDATGEFAELARRAQGVTLSSYRNAYYDKRLLDRDIAELEAEGAAADRSCIFNDIRDLVPHYPLENDPSKLPLKQARPLTTLTWPVECEPRPGTTFAMDAQHAPGSLELSMTADTSYLPRPDMESLLHGIEELVVTEALALGHD